MKNHPFFYNLTYSMFLVSLAIFACSAVGILLGRLLGGAPSAPATYGPSGAARSLVASALNASVPGKAIGDTGLFAITQDGLTSITTTRHDTTPIALACGSIISSEFSILEGLAYDDIAYYTYHSYDFDTNTIGDELLADSLNLKTGEYHEALRENDIPSVISSLTENQLYGSDPLPDGVIRLDKTWYEHLPSPELSVLVSENCKGAVLGGFGAVLLFAALFGVAWFIEKVRG